MRICDFPIATIAQAQNAVRQKCSLSRRSIRDYRDTKFAIQMATLRSLNKTCHACRRNNGNRRLVAGSCTSVFPFVHIYVRVPWCALDMQPAYTHTHVPPGGGGRVSGSLVLSAVKEGVFAIGRQPSVCREFANETHDSSM